MNNNILFASKQCHFCKKIYEMLNKKGLYKDYDILYLEDGYQFPRFVNMVPSVLLTDGGFMEGKSVFEYFEQLSDNVNTVEEVQDYQQEENGGGWSDSFSYIGQGSNGTDDKPIKHSFAFVGEDDNKMISDGQQNLNDKVQRGTQGIDVESLIQQRKQDLEQIMPAIKRT